MDIICIKEWEHVYEKEGVQYYVGVDASKIIDVILPFISDVKFDDRILIEKERIFNMLVKFKDENSICEKYDGMVTFRHNGVTHNGVCDDGVHYNGCMLLNIHYYPKIGGIYRAYVLFLFVGFIFTACDVHYSIEDLTYKKFEEKKKFK